MFANTLTLNLTSDIVLTRRNQDKYGSEYVYRSTTEEAKLLIRQSTTVQKDGRVFNSFNLMVEHVVFATVSTVERTNTASVTVRFEQGASLTHTSEYASALFEQVNTLMSGLLQGEC